METMFSKFSIIRNWGKIWENKRGPKRFATVKGVPLVGVGTPDEVMASISRNLPLALKACVWINKQGNYGTVGAGTFFVLF